MLNAAISGAVGLSNYNESRNNASSTSSTAEKTKRERKPTNDSNKALDNTKTIEITLSQRQWRVLETLFDDLETSLDLFVTKELVATAERLEAKRKEAIASELEHYKSNLNG